MTTKLKLLHKLIGNVMDYNERTGSHIFIDVSPHVSLVKFRYYYDELTGKKVWQTNSTYSHGICVYHDAPIAEIKCKIKEVEEWLKS
ncbi:MAG: hypothetical protein RRY02_09835 [Muribaculaceae bacterium]